MYETQYVLLWLAGVLLSVGAYLGYARGFSGIIGMFVWFVLGNASAALVVHDGAGGTDTYTNLALTWLCYGNAAMHAVVTVMTLYETLTDDADETDADSPDELAEQFGQNNLRNTLLEQ